MLAKVTISTDKSRGQIVATEPSGNQIEIDQDGNVQIKNNSYIGLTIKDWPRDKVIEDMERDWGQPGGFVWPFGIQLECGCKAEYTRETFPHNSHMCKHYNYFVKYEWS